MTRPLQIFAKRLRELRKEMSLRQEDIAKDLNVSRQTISKYERGVREPDFCMLIKLADYYKVSIDFLFGRGPGEGNSFIPICLPGKWIYTLKLPKKVTGKNKISKSKWSGRRPVLCR